jgi:hypothetical protein
MENLYLKWQDYETGKKYVLGALCRDKANSKYYFKLSENYVKKAEEANFSMAMLPFSDINRIYESDILFPFFRMRIPKIQNLDEDDIKELLKEYGMKEFDEFEFLKKSKGKVMTDHFILEEERDC